MITSRKARFFWNSFSSFGYQIVSLICGFILPRLILGAYGSDVNGLVSSITQFLSVVTLSEFGVTAVVQSALYKPLAVKDNEKISQIYVSSRKFFTRIGCILIAYIVFLCIFYPSIVDSNFSWQYISSLVVILSINSLAQYMLGLTNSQLLSADQRAYITTNAILIATILNTIFCYVEIRLGFGIHIVKLTTSIVFLLRPIVSEIYVRKNYLINRKITYTEEPIKQKWNGIAQHFSYYVFNSTDAVVLSVFSTLANVSIYSVYVLVLNGLRNFCSLFDNGIKPILGELLAKNDKDAIQKYFSSYESIIHAIALFVFGCASNLIVPFVSVYTKGIVDANYIQPLFALIITLAYAVQLVKSPYNTIIQAAGHYKETQTNYIVTAVINILVSVGLVMKLGLIGVAVGTLIAATYQTLWQAMYVYRNILGNKPSYFVKHLFVDTIILVLSYTISKIVLWNVDSYLEWIKLAIVIASIWGVIIVVLNWIFYRSEIRYVGVRLLKK